MKVDTHGRWPLVAAAAAVPITALAKTRPGLRPWSALLWHQTEEWVWPGGFLPWINREVLGSTHDEFPLDPTLGLAINAGMGWGSSLAAAAGPGPRTAAPAALLYASNIGNLALHVSWAVRHRRYDPGLITAVTLLGPTAVTGIRALTADPRVPRTAVAAGLGAGAVFSVALPALLKRRLTPSVRS